jgi:hypothetical protein
MLVCCSSGPNTRWSRQRLRRSLYRGLLNLLVGLSRVVALPTRRCGSAFPLGSAGMLWHSKICIYREVKYAHH